MIKTKCECCGKEFMTYKFRLKAKRVCCSNECRYILNKGKGNPSFSNGMSVGQEAICEYCGGMFIRILQQKYIKKWDQYIQNGK